MLCNVHHPQVPQDLPPSQLEVLIEPYNISGETPPPRGGMVLLFIEATSLQFVNLTFEGRLRVHCTRSPQPEQRGGVPGRHPGAGGGSGTERVDA